jgi:predicted tellurium resistance membrane protein TerC
MMLSDVISFITLVVMEVALGIDNIIFVTILASKLPVSMQGRARQGWMVAGIVIRISLLALLSFLIHKLEMPLFAIPLGDVAMDLSGKNLIMLSGGLFLIFKSVKEIHEKLEGEEETNAKSLKNSFMDVMIQIVIVDLVFSIDSIITAIGITDGNNLGVMAGAVIAAMIGIFAFAKPIGDLVIKHPTLKMLALCFLLLIGVLLVAEGFDQHISKGYIYFAMAFSIIVELLNITAQRKTQPVQLKMPHLVEEPQAKPWKD